MIFDFGVALIFGFGFLADGLVVFAAFFGLAWVVFTACFTLGLVVCFATALLIVFFGGLTSVEVGLKGPFGALVVFSAFGFSGELDFGERGGLGAVVVAFTPIIEVLLLKLADEILREEELVGVTFKVVNRVVDEDGADFEVADRLDEVVVIVKVVNDNRLDVVATTVKEENDDRLDVEVVTVKEDVKEVCVEGFSELRELLNVELVDTLFEDEEGMTTFSGPATIRL